MNYYGDLALGDTIDIKFSTVNTSGVPTTLAGSPAVAAYVDNNTTEITAGITLTVDFDARTGMHNVRVVASSGNGFATSTNINLVVTAGTVGGNSVVGYVIGSFSIGKRPVNVVLWAGAAVTSGDIARKTTLAKGTDITGFVDVTAAQVNTEVDTALADIQLDHLVQIADPGGVVANNSFLAKLVSKSATAAFSSYDNTTDSHEALRDNVGTAGAGLTALGDTRVANLDAAVSSRASQASVTALPTAAGNADAVWDEVLSGHLTAGTTGAALNGAGSAGDPWTTSLPGAYGAGTAGNILGNNLNAAVSTRATPAQVQTELGSYGALKPTTAGRTLDVAVGGEAGIDLDNTLGTLAKGTELTGFNDITAANVQSELATYGALKPTVAGRTLDVTTGGEAGVDWGNIGSPTTAQTLSGTTVGTVTTLTNDPAGVTTLLARIPSALFSGITSLAQWLGAMAGKQTGNATARTEIRATGAGSGTFDEVTDSQEAHRDNMGTPQTGDSFARIGAAGAGLTALGDTRIANLDATVSSRASAANLGTPSNLGSGATIAANLVDIENQTDDIGAAGAGLTALGDTRLANLDAAVTSRASSAALATVQADTDDIQARLPAALVSGRIDASTGAIQTAAVDSIWAKAMTELSGIPAITASIFDAVRWVFTASRNKNTQTSTAQVVRNDADSANIASSTVSDDGTTFTRGKFS